MNAEDLVITFKRDIASLSRTERRRLRLRGRALPALRVRRGREEGQIRERRAALPLPGLRQDLRHGQWAHPGDEQAPEGDLDGLCRALRSHAAPARMCGALPCLPQDRLHHAPQADRAPLGLLPIVQGRAVLRLRARRDQLPRVVQGQPREGVVRDAAPLTAPRQAGAQARAVARADLRHDRRQRLERDVPRGLGTRHPVEETRHGRAEGPHRGRLGRRDRQGGRLRRRPR